MTVSVSQLILYSGALVILFLTPGPVWIAIIARTVSGGFKSGIALVLGVLLGDFLWPFIVYGGLGIITSLYADIFSLLPMEGTFEKAQRAAKRVCQAAGNARSRRRH